jgi:hypothetical protein
MKSVLKVTANVAAVVVAELLYAIYVKERYETGSALVGWGIIGLGYVQLLYVFRPRVLIGILVAPVYFVITLVTVMSVMLPALMSMYGLR